MKTGTFQIALRLLACVLILFPHYALAGSVNYPGFINGKIVNPAAMPYQPLQPAPFTINGFYAGKTLTPVGAKDTPVVSSDPGLAPVGLDSSKGTQGIDSSVSGQMIIYQNAPSAIINWQSFNIGSDASVHFNQQGNANWIALNRIWDASPSQIFGTLTADGKIYLINQNGILFGRGSRVNVNSLVASALNIHDKDFLGNVLNFKMEDYQQSGAVNPLAIVSNQGEITTADGGYAFLIGPRVDNYGFINAPKGQIGLVAATNVQLVPSGSDDTTRSGFYVVIDPTDYSNPSMPVSDYTFGNAVNGVSGELRSDGGMVGMYGNNIDQWGVIRSVTAYQNNKGQVELRAANQITTHEGSLILLPVDATPDATTGAIPTVSDTFDIQPVVNITSLQYVNTSSSTGGILDSTNYPKTIELQGNIIAPTGLVTVKAQDSVHMAAGSGIDVSGVIADLPLPLITEKLNSVELRDDYLQKSGFLLGQTITTTLVAGSTIGDLSQTILTRDRTALERSIGGAMRKGSDGTYAPQNGQVNITATAPNGAINIDSGATINISGGAINYAGGFVNTTELVSGNTIYDISKAPLTLQYSGFFGPYTKTYDSFGVSDTWQSPLMTYVPAYAQGGYAGTLKLSAPTVALQGTLLAGVTRGMYQNAWTMQGSFTSTSDYQTALALSVDRGLETPRAGTLEIDNATSLSITAADSGANTLSAAMLNAARLGTINLNNVGDAITTATDVNLILQAGGSFSASARRIEHLGKITVHGGTINLTIQGAAADLTGYQRIILGPDSLLDVSGERIDNFSGTNGSASLNSGRTAGGSIDLIDATDYGSGVFVTSGAVVDVSGGYSIDQKGKITGGNAGSISIQGTNIMLDGDLRGYALADTNGKILGGSITLASTSIDVAQQGDDWSGFNAESDVVPDGLKGKLVLAANRFDNSGFTRITLNSVHDIVMEANTTLAPSLVRLNNPSSLPGQPAYVSLDPSMAMMAGLSSFSLNAASSFSGADVRYTGNLMPADPNKGTITISQGAVINAGLVASSNISLTAPSIDIYGKLESPGGNITVMAKQGDLHLYNTAQILAYGFNQPDPSTTVKGLGMNYQPVNAGNVTLSAAHGSLLLDARPDNLPLIDISGSGAITNHMASGNGSIVAFSQAGNPGSLSLTYQNDLAVDWSSAVKAGKAADNVQGATLVINKTNSSNGMDLQAENIDLAKFTAIGFDDITLKSAKSLIFSSGINNATIGRKLTLDAPVLQGTGQSVSLSAPWIVLMNSNPLAYNPSSDNVSPTLGAFTLFSTGWMDVIGSVQVNGFKDVMMKAVRDIRLSQALYADAQQPSGKLATTGNLVLDADRIYPGNFYSFSFNADKSSIITTLYPDLYSDYTIHADNKVTIQHTDKDGNTVISHSDDPIYSAGGTLTVNGIGGIDVEKGGTLAAPLGTITLTTADANGNIPAGSRIFLADGSVLTTAGNTAVDYGGIDPNNLWVVESKTNPSDIIYSSTIFTNDRLPAKGITLTADTVITMNGSNGSKGSVIDVSGGGSVFAYKFQPSVNGSNDPLTAANSYIVISGSYQLPGASVQLQGGGGLSAGTYTLLPLNAQNARYAFMPGAYILQAQTSAVVPASGSLSSPYGYPLIVGYTAMANNPSVLGARPQVYTIRSASTVLSTQGDYVNPSLVSGNAGDISITGKTSVLNGVFNAAPLPGYVGGKISLSAMNIFVQSGAASQLPSDFNFDTPINSNSYPELQNNLTLSADGLQGFREVDLGDVDTTKAAITNSITVQAGANLVADSISLAASKTTGATITLETGAQLTATNGDGVINLTTPGTLIINSGVTVNASNSVTLDANNMQVLPGTLLGDGALTLKSSAIFLGSGSGTVNGLYLTQATWDSFQNLQQGAKFQDITLLSRSDMQFNNAMTLSAARSLTLDAQRIVGAFAGNTTPVTLSAATVNLKNSGAASSQAAPSTMIGTFAVQDSVDGKIKVNQINIGNGDLLVHGFQNIALNSHGDVAFQGVGSLSTGNANLSITAPRVITSPGTKADGTYQAPNFHVYTGSNYNTDFGILSGSTYNPNPQGTITFINSGDSPSTAPTAGGILEFWGKAIQNGGTVNADNTINKGLIIQSDGGNITLVAMGPGSSDGIILNDGAQILAQGTADAPGGNVTLSTVNGGITIANNTNAQPSIDVSGAQLGPNAVVNSSSQLDAGSVTLLGPTGGVSIQGSIKGTAGAGKDSNGNSVTGRGGSFTLHTNQLLHTAQIDDLAALNLKLQQGGFTELIDLRARTGNIDVASGVNVTANHIKLTADDSSVDPITNNLITDATGNPLNGNINVAGTLNADTPDGSGLVELYAMNNININDATAGGSGKIFARGTGANAQGGYVILSSEQGMVNVYQGGDATNKVSAIDVSSNGGKGGTVYLRAQQNGNDVKINLANGAINTLNTFLSGTSGVKLPLTISSGANTITFSYNGTSYTATVSTTATPYNDGTALAMAVQTALNSTAAGNIFVVDYGVTTTGQLTIRNTSAVSGAIFSTAAGNTTLFAQLGFTANTVSVAPVVYAEAVKTYNYNSTNPLNVDSATYTGWLSTAGNYYTANSNAIVNRLADPLVSNFHLLAGIEVISAGDINWNAAWVQGNGGGTRFGGEPGVLTLRATGNLNINANLVDAPTPIGNLTQSSVRDSWGFNLVAGANTSSADYMAVNRTGSGSTGNLTLANNTVVYTESAPIRFASGGNTIIGSLPSNAPGYMVNTFLKYNLASYDGSIQGNVGHDLIINGGAIQTATGDIGITVGRDLQLNFDSSLQNLGAVRTTGQLTYEPTSTATGASTVIGNDVRDPQQVLINGVLTTLKASDFSTTSGKATNYSWRYADGGNITLNVGGHVGTWDNTNKKWVVAQNSAQWDYFTSFYTGGISKTYWDLEFSANYQQGTAGLATMAGGNLIVHAGSDFLAQAGTFGAGNLAIYSGGDIAGRFLNHGSEDVRGVPGSAKISAMGNFGSAALPQQLELFNSQMAVSALGAIQIGAVLNPDLASNVVQNSNYQYIVNCTYTPNTSISLKAGTDVTMTGTSPFYAAMNTSQAVAETVLPATVDIVAGGDINLLHNFTLTSSATGNLNLQAGGSISGSYKGSPASILMSDIDPSYWYGHFIVNGTTYDQYVSGWFNNRAIGTTVDWRIIENHGFFEPADAAKQAAAAPLHTGDAAPITIQANGDIENLNFYLPKQAEVTAGQDIVNITYVGQNIDAGDVSEIRAGGNISIPYVKASSIPTTDANTVVPPYQGLIQSGPGVFLVQAGGSIDLGTLKDGIQTIGNSSNPALGTGTSSLVILSGYTQNLPANMASTFFDELRDSGDLYSLLLAGGTQADAEKLVNAITTKEAKAELAQMLTDAGSEAAFYQKLTAGGNSNEANALLQDTRSQTIGILTPTGAGDINMTSSQISTSIGKSDIYIIANGNVNLGKTALPTSSTTSATTGITTGGGGAINIFSRLDVNVNESRIMTFYGGDITVWTDEGSINAGRGSSTAVSASPPKKIKNANGTYTTVFVPPAIGSGIRAVTYGDDPLVTPGNIHLFAPSGIIDAGEAGIAGGQIILAALHINNAGNISFTAGSVGVPQASSGTANIGNMSGSGLAGQGSQLTSDASGIRQQAAQVLDDIMAKWLDVKVFDFVLDDNPDDTKKEK